MKRTLVFLTAILLGTVFLLSGCGSSSSTSSAKNDENTFIIGVDDQFPPMGYRDKSGNIVGFDIDLATEAAARMGKKLVVQQIDWSAKEMELAQGNIDAIWNGLTITDERKAQMDFTDPYLENDQVIVVKKDSAIKTKADLSGKKVGIQKSSSAEDALNADAIKDALAEVVSYDENVSALQDLGIGRTDAVVVDSVVANWYIKDNDADYRLLEESLAPEKYGIAVKKGNTELLNAINSALNDMRKDGKAAEISKTWFGSDIIYSGK